MHNLLIFLRSRKISSSSRSINFFARVSRSIQLFDFTFTACKGIVHKDE